jgi:hypothetical protein
MLFKFYFKRTMVVDRTRDNRPFGGEVSTSQEEKSAFSEVLFFTDLDKAKAYAQLHTPIPLVWEDNSNNYGYHNSVAGPKSDNLDFMIVIEKGSIDPVTPLPIPADAALQFDDHVED